MSRHDQFRGVGSAVLAAVLFVGANPAWAQPMEEEEDTGRITDVTGKWSGFTELSGLGSETEVVELTVDSQRHRRFFGTMMVGDAEFDLAGTASASGVVNLVGDGVGSSPGIGTSSGLYRVESIDGGAAVLLGGLRVNGNNGGSQRGSQFFVRQYDFDPAEDRQPASVAGEWSGNFASALADAGGEISADFEHPDLSATRFLGDLSFIEQDNLFNFTTLEGSINSEGKIILVAMAEPEHGVVIVLEGDHVAPPPPPPPTDDDVSLPPPAEAARIRGVYRVFSVSNDSRLASGKTLIDFGTFEIIAIIIGL